MLKQKNVLDSWRILPYPLWKDHNVGLPEYCTSHDISKIWTHNTPGRKKRSGWGGGGPTLPNVLFRVSRRCRATPRGQHICAHHHHHRHQHHPLATRTLHTRRRTERVSEGSTHLCTANPQRLTTYLPMAYSRLPKNYSYFAWTHKSLFGFDQQQYLDI